MTSLAPFDALSYRMGRKKGLSLNGLFILLHQLAVHSNITNNKVERIGIHDPSLFSIEKNMHY